MGCNERKKTRSVSTSKKKMGNCYNFDLDCDIMLTMIAKKNTTFIQYNKKGKQTYVASYKENGLIIVYI